MRIDGRVVKEYWTRLPHRQTSVFSRLGELYIDDLFCQGCKKEISVILDGELL